MELCHCEGGVRHDSAVNLRPIRNTVKDNALDLDTIMYVEKRF